RPGIVARSTSEMPAFSPYQFIQRVSRSLSPMRYYLEGLEVADDGENGGGSGGTDVEMTDAGHVRGASGSTTARNHASLLPPRRAEEEDEDADGDVDFWGADGGFLSGEEYDDDDDEGSESESDSDAEMEDDDDEPPGAEDGEVQDMELFGHR
ncbi:hypothetical protein LTR28_002376, partial [Elasticomyces elasticus]